MIIASGNCTVKIVDSAGNGAISSAGKLGAALDGATLEINGGTFTSTGNIPFWAGGKENTGHVVVNAGTITGQEFALGVGKNSSITINGGKLVAKDNAVVGGNGSVGYENATIVINDGELEGHIQTAGYTGCGIYMPNSGSVTINGGKITADGVGICARAGEIFIKGGEFVSTVSTEGWVGDKKTQISANGVFYDGAAKYPGLDASAKVKITGGTFINTADATFAGVKVTQPDNGITVQVEPGSWTVQE